MNHADQTWQEITNSIESLVRLAKESVSPTRFQSELMERLIELTAASGGGFWTADRNDAKECQWRLSFERVAMPQVPESEWFSSHHRVSRTTVVAFASDCERARNVAADQRIQGAGDQTRCCDLALARVQIDGESVAIVELVFEPNRPPALRDATHQLLDVATEIASDYYRNCNLRQLKDRAEARDRFDRFTLKIHEDFDLVRVSQAIASDGRELLACDRLCVVLQRGNRMKVESVSGVDVLDRRSQTVIAIERLASECVSSVGSSWFRKDSAEKNRIPAVSRYFEDTDAVRVGLIAFDLATPANSQKMMLAVLVAEYFDTSEWIDEDLLQGRGEWMAQHARCALRNAASLSRLPLAGLGRWIDSYILNGRRLSWGIVFTLSAIAIAVGLCVIPGRFVIQAQGELQPVHQEFIFAPRDGIVKALLAVDESGSVDSAATDLRVQEGDIVLQLENAELEYQLTSLLGEQATIDQQLDTVAVTLEQIGRSNDPQQRVRFDELTAQSLELRVQKQSLEKRIRLLRDESEKLTVEAGISGRISNWNVRDELMLKPVQQGERLMQIIDPDGPWQLDLYVPDRHIGYVQTARRSQTQPLALTFVHQSNPQSHYRGSVTEIATSTEWYAQYGAAVRVIGTIEQSVGLTELRPGTTVIAKIDCGKKPIGFVWLYDLIDTVRMKLLF